MAVLEVQAIETAPWAEKTENGKNKFNRLMTEIGKRRAAIELFEEYSAPDFKFITVTLRP